MPYRLRITDAARRDLAEARRWLTQAGAGPRATNRLDHIRRAILVLADDPLLWPESEHVGYRARSVARHRIIYRVDVPSGSAPGIVTIMRIFGPGRSQDVR